MSSLGWDHKILASYMLQFNGKIGPDHMASADLDVNKKNMKRLYNTEDFRKVSLLDVRSAVWEKVKDLL